MLSSWQRPARRRGICWRSTPRSRGRYVAWHIPDELIVALERLRCGRSKVGEMTFRCGGVATSVTAFGRSDPVSPAG
jgi:hypothetical protein